MNVLRRLARWETSLVILLVVELLALSLLSPKFLDISRLLQSSSDYVWIGMVAIPLVLVMISGGIDISIGSMISLCSITLGVVYAAGAPIWIAIAAALGVGMLAGFVNGLLILITGAQAIVITLGTLFLYAGIAVGLSGLGGVSAYEGISALPDAFVDFGNGDVLGIPNQALVFLVMVAVFSFLLHGSLVGRRLRLIGVNPETARYAGIPVGRTTVFAYVMTGLGAAISGTMLTAYFASARPDLGATALLPAVTAVVVGGVSIYGGTGTVFGAAVATVVIGLLTQGLRFTGLPNEFVIVLIGVVLILAAATRSTSAVLLEHIRAQHAKRTTDTRVAKAVVSGEGS
jgi:AI-2 transport system permease protein